MLNPHILLALKFLNNPKSVSEEELGESWKVSILAYDNATSARNIAAQMYCDYDYIYDVEKGDYDAAYQYAIKTLDEYFKDSGENQEAYTNRINYLDHINHLAQLESTNA